MAVALENVAKPPCKLRKLLKRFPVNPSPDAVHALRTQARRLEAVIDAVEPEPGKQSIRILKLIKPVRKAAGAVRDMDVQIENVFALSRDDTREALVGLVEYLAKMREKHGRHLLKIVERRRKEVRSLLRRYAAVLEKRSKANPHGLMEGGSAPRILTTELGFWPKLDAENLHPFRVQVKKLRYMLQVAGHPGGSQMNALANVKDTIGDWHDWTGLLKVAEKVLDSKADGAVLKQIEGIREKKFRLALTSAKSLRRQDLEHLAEVSPGKLSRRKRKRQ
jgi:CHAD domain-containing protein